MTATTHITTSNGSRVEIERGDYIVSTSSPSREDWDWGEVVHVADGYIEVAWRDSMQGTEQPIGALDGCDLYRTRAAALDAYEAALAEPERDPHRGGRGIRAPGERWSVMLRASEDERADIEQRAEAAGLPVGRYLVERALE